MKLEYLFIGYVIVVVLRFYWRAIKEELHRRRRRACLQPAASDCDGYLYHRLHPSPEKGLRDKQFAPARITLAQHSRDASKRYRAVPNLMIRRS
jgi:hypothetical protein